MSNQQYRHAGRKLSPSELVEFLTDQHSAMADDPIMLWLSMSLEDMADVIIKAIRCSESSDKWANSLSAAATAKSAALAAARAFSDGQDSFDDWRQA